MDREFGIDLDAIVGVIREAEVFIVRFGLIDQRLLVDARPGPTDQPIIRLVPRVHSAEERYRYLRRERPSLGLPEQITVFEWPRRIQVMRDIGLWEHIEQRLVTEGGPELAEECERAFQSALRAERIDLIAAIRGGEGYETVWERSADSP